MNKSPNLEFLGLRIKKNKLLAILGYSNQQHANIFHLELVQPFSD